MQKFILFFALLISAIGFSNTGENELRKNLTDSEIIELFTSNLNIDELNTPMLQSEITDIYFDEFAPCKLTVTVYAKVVIDGAVAAEMRVEGSLQLDDCNDIGGIGATFLRGLINEAIEGIQRQLNG